MYTLLVVEDKQSLREWYTEELEKEGYSVTSVANAKEALNKIEKGQIDLVILDIKMPGMDGLELLSKVLGEQIKVPLIINTAYPHYKNNFMSWAAEAYIVKSSDLGELKKAIQKVLRKFYPEKSDE
jgi:DNA-binding response OmpR family regulator